MIARRLGLLAVTLSVLSAAALGPLTARAGIQTWNSPVCTEPVAVSQLFTNAFTSFDKCESLCKLAANRCKQGVNDAASCEKKNRTDVSKALELAFCGALTGAQKSNCLKGFRADLKLSKEALAADRTLALANCTVYRAECLSFCAN